MLLRTFSKIIKETNVLRNYNNYRTSSCLLGTNFLGVSCRILSTSNIKFKISSNTEPTIIQRVYCGPLTPQIKAVKVFSLSSSIVGLIAQPFLYKELSAMGNVSLIVAVYSFIGFFTFVTPLLLHTITKKYVTQLDYMPKNDSYVVNTINFFCMTTQTKFQVNDVKVPEVPGMFTTFIAKGKSLFIDPKFFDNPHHYARLMGYDKPMDFKLYSSDSSSDTETSSIKNKS